MAERKSLLTRSTAAPTIQGQRIDVPRGAFGDYSGLINFGQGVQQAGQAGMQAATAIKNRQEQDKLRREHELKSETAKMEQIRMRDLKNKALAEARAAATGMAEQFNTLATNRQLEPDAVAQVGRMHDTTRSNLQESMKESAADPLWEQSGAKYDVDEILASARHSLSMQAIGYQGSQAMGDRMLTHQTFIRSLGRAPGDTADSVIKMGTERAANIYSDNISAEAKVGLQSQLADQMFGYLKTEIEWRGFRPDIETIRKIPVLDERQRNALMDATRVKTPGGMTVSEANTVIDVAETAIADGKQVPDAQGLALAVFRLSHPAEGEDLSAAKARLTKLDWTMNSSAAFAEVAHMAVDGDMTHEQITVLSNELENPEGVLKAVEAIYPEIHKVPSSIYAGFLAKTRERVAQVKKAFDTGRTAQIFDSRQEIAPLVKGVQEAWNLSAQEPTEANILKLREAAASYRTAIDTVATKRGIAPERRQYVPDAVLSSLEGAFRLKQPEAAVNGILNIRNAFGPEGVSSVVEMWSNTIDGEPHKLAHLAAFVVLMDMASVDGFDGQARNRAEASAKDMFSAVADLEANEKAWTVKMSDWKKITAGAYGITHYDHAPSLDQILAGIELGSTSSEVQSFFTMGQALGFQHGMNNGLTVGFQRMAQAHMAQRVLGAQSQYPDVDSMKAAMGHAAKDVLNAYSQFMTVVDTSASNNRDALYGVVATGFHTPEESTQLPLTGGARNAARFGAALGRTLKAVTYAADEQYDRTGAGNVVDVWESFHNTFIRHSPLSVFNGIPLNDYIKAMPKSVIVPWAKTDIGRNYAGAQGGWLKSLTTPTSWGVAGDPATVKGMTMEQKGGWMVSKDGRNFVAVVRAKGQSESGAPSVSSGSYRVVNYTDTGKPVEIPIKDLWYHHGAYRTNRMGPFLLGPELIRAYGEDVVKKAAVPDNLFMGVKF